MILCKVVDGGLQYVQDDLGKIAQYKSTKELIQDMNKNPDKFEADVTYTLHDVKPFFIVRKVIKNTIEIM